MKRDRPDIRPHGLRHTAATLLLLEGVQPLVVSEILGHANVAFTLATYGHVQAEMHKLLGTQWSAYLAVRSRLDSTLAINPEKQEPLLANWGQRAAQPPS
jgi:Phage integrase family